MVSARFGANLPVWFTIPNSRRNSQMLVSLGRLVMASTLAGSTLIRSCEMMWPRNLMVSTEKTHFSLSVTPASCFLSSTDHSRSSCSC